ncbi:MAG: putative leucine/isoleucine/valine-binding protein precursor [Myxococcales bacterium]|nr:putative leucine/isoleucine/valine-binding protein precursor [Myxococcales bacterium]
MRGLRAHYSIVLLAVGCSTDFSPKPCSLDGDCGTGLVCELRELQPVCVHAADAPLVIGSSSAISGTNYELGTGMKLGIELALAEQNAKGGVRGRQLVLNFRDDAYDPPIAETAARALADVQIMDGTTPKCPSTTTPEPDGHGNTTPISTTALSRGPNAVLAFLGNVGTPTMVRAAPIALETGTIYFGAYTGAAKILRDTTAGECAKYVFNVRASYAQEAQATTDLFKKKGVPDYKSLISFDQNDTFGDAGYNGLKAAYVVDYGAFPASADPTTPIARFRYARNDDTSVPTQAAAVEAYLTNLLNTNSGVQTVGVMMTDTYGAGATFIQLVRQWQFDGMQTTLDKPNRLKLYFSNVSFVGPNALSSRLVQAGSITIPSANATLPGATSLPLTQDVTVSQVVPNYQSDTSDVVTTYNKLIAANSDTPGFTSLEGYISTRIFIAGLLANKGPFTPDGLITTFESLPDLSLGIGASSGYSATNHQYSNSVWGTSILPNGSFKNQYFWTVGSAIQFYE